jgi:hypothetical protein
VPDFKTGAKFGTWGHVCDWLYLTWKLLLRYVETIENRPHSCIKKMAKMTKTIISAEQNTCQAPFFALNQRCTEGSGLFYAIFSTLRESRRAPNPALASVRSKVLRLHACRLDFGALRLLQQWGRLSGCQFVPLHETPQQRKRHRLTSSLKPACLAMRLNLATPLCSGSL